jgi:hypothetical protein
LTGGWDHSEKSLKVARFGKGMKWEPFHTLEFGGFKFFIQNFAQIMVMRLNNQAGICCLQS